MLAYSLIGYSSTKVNTFRFSKGGVRGPGGGGGGTQIFSHIRRLGPFFGVQNSEFQYFFGFSEK